MTNDDRILELLTEIRDLQRQSLANQEKSMAAQMGAIEKQNSHLRLYRIVVLVTLPLIAVLGYMLFKVAGPWF